MLLSVQLLQVILLAASAVCDPAAGAVPGGASPLAMPVASAPQHHHGEHVSHDVQRINDSDEKPAGAPSAPSHHAPSAPCPMAMACTVTAVVAEVPTIATGTVIVPALVLSHEADAPASVHPAPETPPPRG